MDKRNWKIYFEWIEGKNYNILAKEFNLSKDTIKTICTSKVPPSIREKHWQRVNQYENWRKFKRTELENHRLNKQFIQTVNVEDN